MTCCGLVVRRGKYRASCGSRAVFGHELWGMFRCGVIFVGLTSFVLISPTSKLVFCYAF